MGADSLVHHGEAVGGEGVLAGERGQQHLVAGLQAAAAAQRGRDGDVAAGGRVTMPPGSRRAVTTPASAVKVSRSPPAQPSAAMMACSQMRPEASMRAIPYTTSCGTDRTGRASGSGRPAAAWHAAGQPGRPTRGSREREAARSRHPPGEEEGRASRDESGKAVGGDGQVMRLRGISRPSRRLKRRLTTQAGEISPEGEITRPRVQALVEPGKMRGYLCPRGDLNRSSI